MINEFKLIPKISFARHEFVKLRFFNNGEGLHWSKPDRYGTSYYSGWRDFGPISIWYTNGLMREDLSIRSIMGQERI